jgi:hypothetical protein
MEEIEIDGQRYVVVESRLVMIGSHTRTLTVRRPKGAKLHTVHELRVGVGQYTHVIERETRTESAGYGWCKTR